VLKKIRKKAKNIPREPTKYPGVFVRRVKRIAQSGTEKVFYIVFKKDGKTIEEKAGRQYQDAMTEAKAARIRGERIEGKRPSPSEIREARKKTKKDVWTIDRLFTKYKEQHPGLKNFAPDETRFRLYIQPSFGKKEPQEIYPLDVDRLRVKMLKTLAPQTVKLTLALFRRICNFGFNKRLCKPLSFKIEMPKVYNLKTEDLTSGQIENLVKAIDANPHLVVGKMMKLALFTGMRKGEMLKLKWRDIDFDRGFITLEDPKGGVAQKIPLNDQARGLFDSMVKTESPFVFPGRGGRQRVEIGPQARKIRELAKLPKDFRPLHGLRHVFASMLASSGEVGLYELQKLLTHKDPKLTMRYAHLRDEALQRASGVAGRLIDEITKPKPEIKFPRIGTE
jgi:integrase